MMQPQLLVPWISFLVGGGSAFVPQQKPFLKSTNSENSFRPFSWSQSPKNSVLQNQNSGFGGGFYQDGDENEEEPQEEEEEVLYNDFDFVIGGDSTGNLSPMDDTTQGSLQQRIREQQQQELKRETQLLQNWKSGDWTVRGFSLDPADAINEAVQENHGFEQSQGGTNILPTPSTTPIHISKVVADANSEGTRVWVGRSNGSLVWVKLGSEYTTHFRSKISGTFGQESAQFSSELVRDPNPFADQGSGGEPNYSSTPEEPFQVLAQFSPANEEAPISTILSVPDEDCIFTACEGSGQINQWHIGEADIGSEKPALQTPLPLSDGIHNAPIVTLKTVVYQESPLLLSVSADGVMALWSIPKADLIFHCKISIEEIMEPEEAISSQVLPSHVLHCADADDNHIFLGTTSGHVLGYDVADLLMSASSGGTCPLPQGKFQAHEGGVTAIACGGPGSLGRLGGVGGTDQRTSSSVLISGGMDGQVKQWEVLSSPSMQKMENWPKISTQRLPKKAHLFDGHNGPITALEAMGGRRPQFLSASEDGTIRAWDSAKGKESYRMDGFTKELSSLCLLGSSETDDDFLVTNGMNQYVCVHDFSQGLAGDSTDDFLEPWNE